MNMSRVSLLASVAIVMFVIIQSWYIQTVGAFTRKDLFYHMAALVVLIVVIFMFCGGSSKNG